MMANTIDQHCKARKNNNLCVYIYFISNPWSVRKHEAFKDSQDWQFPKIPKCFSFTIKCANIHNSSASILIDEWSQYEQVPEYCCEIFHYNDRSSFKHMTQIQKETTIRTIGMTSFKFQINFGKRPKLLYLERQSACIDSLKPCRAKENRQLFQSGLSTGTHFNI